VINESWPWKRRLAKDADIIERWAAKPKITDRRSFLLEEKIFLAAYAMRKLVEANKLSSSFEGSSINCRIFPRSQTRSRLQTTTRSTNSMTSLE
jgi:hypothetical protein